MSTTIKYIGGGLILASIFALVILGKVDATVYLGIASSVLAGFGIHAAVTTPYPLSSTQDKDTPS